MNHSSRSRTGESSRALSRVLLLAVVTASAHAWAAGDDAPDIDLLANRYLLHLYREGLVVPVAAEGLRKYSQEYSSPWGEVVTVEGKAGRVLAGRAATLRVPWESAGDATLVARLHPLASGQRLSLKVNGANAGNVTPEAGWQAVARPVKLRAGENEVFIALAKKGSAGGASGYALIHSVELVPGGATPAEAWPPLTPAADVTIGGRARPALTGFSRMAFYVEIPEGARLEVDTGAAGAGEVSVSARTFDGKPKELLRQAQPPGVWVPRKVALDAFAGRLVRLELAGTGGAAWAAPRIVLQPAPSTPRHAPYKNLILFVVDALRADHLEVYGKTRVRTPNVTKAADAHGAVFLYNQAASPSSPPSHGAIQTGMIPRVHGVTGDKAQLLPGTPMISTQAGAAGLATGYYGNNSFGMARLEKPGRWTEFHQPPQEGLGIDCDALVPEILKFAGKQKAAGKRFFVSSLPYEPHTPYRFHPGVTERFHAGPWGPPVGKMVNGDLLGGLSSGKVKLNEAQWAQLRALYDGEVEHVDACFGDLLAGLDKLGIADDTAVILTSDHGEGMYEHGRMGHAFGHFAELGNVPLVVLVPGQLSARRTVETVTSHLDIAPTVLDLLGVPRSDRIQGISLVPMMLRQGPWTPRVMPLEYGRSYALRARRWKYIVDYSGQESLFDLEKDPTEQEDLLEKNPFALRYLRDVAGFFLAHRTEWHMERWGSLNNHTAAFVEAMGGRRGK